MAQIEQAVFTSARTDRSVGYQIVASSPGIDEADLRELSVWGPSHDSLLELGPDAVSINFHPLPSGMLCVSRTTPAGWEYSGRGGHRIYTQCLVLSPDALERFGNNPFSLVKAAMAGGMFDVLDETPSRLDPLLLAGGAAPVDSALLARLAANPGPAKVAGLLQLAMETNCLAVAGQPSAGDLIAGLISCLPPQCRSQLSFCTGLKYSSRRPFRIVAISDDKAEQRWVVHQNVTVVDLADNSTELLPHTDGWARFIHRVLESGRISFLTSQLSKRRFELTAEDLPALGLQLLEDLDASALRTDHAAESWPAVPSASPSDELDATSWDSVPPVQEPVPPTMSPVEGAQRAHAAHQRFGHGCDMVTAEKIKAVAPSRTLETKSPDVLKRLEHLDDLVYDAISGSAMAMKELESAWQDVLTNLDEELVADSREQYLRYALSIWEECMSGNGLRRSARAVQALDVLCMLFNEM